jgi:hypothetical protein
MSLDAGIDERIDAVLSRLREGVGASWIEPVRTHFDLRAKRRAGRETDYAVTVTCFFETGLRVYVIENFGTTEWVIKAVS